MGLGTVARTGMNVFCLWYSVLFWARGGRRRFIRPLLRGNRTRMTIVSYGMFQSNGFGLESGGPQTSLPGKGCQQRTYRVCHLCYLSPCRDRSWGTRLLCRYMVQRDESCAFTLFHPGGRTGGNWDDRTMQRSTNIGSGGPGS